MRVRDDLPKATLRGGCSCGFWSARNCWLLRNLGDCQSHLTKEDIALLDAPLQPELDAIVRSQEGR